MSAVLGAVSRRAVFAGFVILSVLALVPVLAVRLPPILDYPNHLARMHVLAALHASANLQRFYSVAWSPIPNLAFDAIVPRLVRFMPVEDAMRLFLIATLLGAAGGTVALHRVAFQRWSIWPLFAFLLLYNRMLLWGFLNYLAGLTLALWALALWIALDRRPAALRVALGLVLATAIYLAHLAAFGCYALAVVAFALAPPPGERFIAKAALRRAAPSLVTLLPAALLFLLSPTSDVSTAIDYGNPLRKFDLPVSIFDNYDRIFDGATFAIALIAIFVGFVSRGIVLHSRLRWSVMALIVAYASMPSRLLSASGIDHRMPIAIAFLFVGVSDWSRVSARWQRRIAVFAFALLAVRLELVASVWVAADRQYAALAPAFDAIPIGSRLAVAVPAGDVRAGGIPLLHFPTLAVARRDAFVPTLFVDPAQQPVHFTPEAGQLAAEANAAGLWDGLVHGSRPALAGYDNLMIVDPPPTLDHGPLPGAIVFDSPRLIVVRLPTGDSQPGGSP